MVGDMEHYLSSFPLVVRRDHPGHSSAIDHFLRVGSLVRVLPGVHRWAEVEETFALRAEAAQRWQVNGIFSGSTAARLSWWPDLKDDTIRMICGRNGVGVGWLETSRQAVPDDLLVTEADVRMVSPELSILQMCASGDAAPICRGLREEVVTLASLGQALALLPRTARGKQMMRRLLHEARDEPWSTLELDGHRLLRGAGITGWRTNVHLVVGGEDFFGDIVFHRERIIVELDGRPFHTHAELDENNRRRNALEAEGWRVFNFSGATLPQLIPTLLPLLREARSAWRRDRLPLLPLADDRADSQNDGAWDVA